LRKRSDDARRVSWNLLQSTAIKRASGDGCCALMPERFNSGAYDPELIKLMSAAVNAAWDAFEPRPRNEPLAKSLMASAVIENVEAGVNDRETLVRRATIALIAAIKIDPAELNIHPRLNGAKRPSNPPAPRRQTVAR